MITRDMQVSIGNADFIFLEHISKSRLAGSKSVPIIGLVAMPSLKPAERCTDEQDDSARIRKLERRDSSWGRSPGVVELTLCR